MLRFIDINGLHFVGKFNELISQLSAIENKQMTLREYVLSFKNKLN